MLHGSLYDGSVRETPMDGFQNVMVLELELVAELQDAASNGEWKKEVQDW